MLFKTIKATPIAAPTMAVPPEPHIVAERNLRVVYRGSPSDEDPIVEHWIVASFDSYLFFSHGYPNDEALGAHPLAKFGLKFYEVFEISNSPLIADICRRNSVHDRHSDSLFSKDRHWVFTFQDETLDVVSTDAPTFEVVAAGSPAEALERVRR